MSPWSFCPSGKLKKFENGTWHVVPPEDQVKMTKLDGQVWLALLNLLLSPECQHKYRFDGFNKSQLLKVGPCSTKALGTSRYLSPSSLWAPRSQWWENSKSVTVAAAAKLVFESAPCETLISLSATAPQIPALALLHPQL